MRATDTDVIVVGGGNAGLVAALAARERGRKVMLLERGNPAGAGGNSFFTAGATRIVHDGLEDLIRLVEPDERHERTVVPPYSADDYAADLAKVTQNRNDPVLTEAVVTESRSTLQWLKDVHGMRYRLMYERQAYEGPGGFLFWGGLHVGNVNGGEGLITDATAAAMATGVEIRYGYRARELVMDGARVVGVRGDSAGEPFEVRAESVILAAGGFEADPDLRRQYLGAGWENAKVRGTPFNRGDMLRAALAVGAARGGDWSTAHSVAWDAAATHNESNRELTNRLTRQSYPLGVVVNRDGRRFLDEGADFRNYTYARYGGEILKQPGSIAFQLFDARLRPMLRTEEYDMPGVGVHVADTVDALADAAGIDAAGLSATLAEFNASIDLNVPLDPNVKDGRAARVVPPKSNWASPISEPPFWAYPVTCGITFTFGGVKGDAEARVLDESGNRIPGLFAVGEMLGGLFSGNYPGGSGLAVGAVMARRAGAVA